MLLRDKDRKSLMEIFNTVDFPIEIWAYGSRVTGDAFEGSDLDLVIRSPDLQRLPADIFLDLKEKIQKSNIPILVDLYDWARLPESFHRNIESNYEVLFSNIPSQVNDANGNS